MEERHFNHQVMTEIRERWSPRAFSDKSVPQSELLALLEAARFAPSCNNEQPWRFIVADNSEKLKRMQSVLNEGNQGWAVRAPLLLMILASRNFEGKNSENRFAAFDSGTAWGYLSLEAQRRGLITHAMGGFSVEKARQVFNVPSEYEIVTVVAIGYYGNKSDLSDFNQQREHPSARKEIKDLIL